MSDNLRRILSVDEAATYCGISRRTLYELHEAGLFPRPLALPSAQRDKRTKEPTNGGKSRRVLWDLRDLDAWIDAQKQATAEEEARGQAAVKALLRGRVA